MLVLMPSAAKHRLIVAAIGLLIAGCASRAVDVKPLAADPADFLAWDCTRIDDELDAVQQRAADLAYAVDERAGNNIIALGVGVTIFWPAILAMRPDGPEAEDLARLRGRFDALRSASRHQACPPPPLEMPAQRAAALPVMVGERLVYEERAGGKPPSTEWGIRLAALHRDELEFRPEAETPGSAWRQDLAGNVTAAPPGALVWPRLLRRELVLGQVVAGEIDVAGNAMRRARVRGQVMAVGPQVLAGRRFDAAVIDLFGDAQDGDQSTRLDGAIVVDRKSGVLLRLDLRSAMSNFNLQRRLTRVEAALP